MADDLSTVATELKSVWESELKPRIEQMEGEQRSSGEAVAETKQAIDRVQDRLDEIEALAQKAQLASGRKEGESSQDVKDMVQFVRTGGVPEESKLYSAKSADEQKVLAIRDETLGGVLAPPDFIAEIVKGIIQFSPIRQIATTRQTSRTSVQFPKRTGNFAAQWTSEVATRSETTTSVRFR